MEAILKQVPDDTKYNTTNAGFKCQKHEEVKWIGRGGIDFEEVVS